MIDSDVVALYEQIISLLKITVSIMFMGFAFIMWYIWTESSLIRRAIAIIVASDPKLADKVSKMIHRPKIMEETKK